jgi:hypothetical protein
MTMLILLHKILNIRVYFLTFFFADMVFFIVVKREMPLFLG